MRIPLGLSRTAHCMKAIIVLLVLLLGASETRAVADSEPEDTCDFRFKARYHRWVAAIYDHPKIMLMSDSRAYTNLPEFTEMVKLGPCALPAIAREIQNQGDQALFLGEAILQITNWDRADFEVWSLQELNERLLNRLREQRLIPDSGHG